MVQLRRGNKGVTQFYLPPTPTCTFAD